MKILLLASPDSIHTIKWANSLSEKGYEIHIFGLCRYVDSNFNLNVKVHIIDLTNTSKGKEGAYNKVAYLKALPLLRKLIRQIEPDIVHAHYASSYGLLGALSGFQPLIISVWGSDIFEFPRISIIHKIIIKYGLMKASTILSTSNVMAIETKKYTKKNINVTPFGIDIEKFKAQRDESKIGEKDIVIGTIKSLEEIYGIEYLIKAFKILTTNYSKLPLKLLIVGSGSLDQKLKELCIELKIMDNVIFTGFIQHQNIVYYYNMIDIYVALSLRESFGVAIIEAQACEKPVVVSNVGGLPEVIEDKVTGFVVPAKNELRAAEAIERLLLDKELRIKMGKAGRERVKKLYEWNSNVDLMVNIYKSIINI